MKQNFNTRLCNDLFPEMPQSFMDGLQNAMKKADVKPRKHVLRKILIGASAAVLAAACALIVIFGVFVRNRKHTAAVPPASEESTLVGIWTLTRVEMRTESTVLFGVETEKWGDITDQIDYESWLEFTADGYVTLTTYFPDMGEALHNSGSYTVSGDTVTAEWRVPLVTGEEKDVSLSMRYDAESDTICTDSGHRREYYARTPDAVIFSRVLNKQTLTGIWKQTRSEHSVDPSPLDGFDYDYLKWEKEQTWEEDAEPQPWYLEFTADGRMYRFLYAPDGGVQGNQSAPYTISGNTLQWSGWTLRYEAETDTICWILWDRREYYERVPDAVIDDPYRQKISDLRKQYPEYFDLYATPRLKVIVWQMAEGSYSCALVPGSDLRKEAEIGIESRGTTIEEMRMILSTYYEARDCNIEPEQVEVVPFHNPISSYWYEIDEAYTGRLRWLITGTSFESDDPLYSLLPKGAYGGDPPAHYNFRVSEVCDIDGDGTFETCMLTKGPTSGLFTFTLTAYHNGTAVYRNTFNTANGYLSIQRKKQGLWLINYDPENLSGKPQGRYTGTVENGRFVLTDRETGETVEYWGLADPHWNMN